jgi:predicted RNase H-like HicB family nuclease
MKIKVVIHQADEGGYWAEVPALPGCATQGESFEELLQNLYEAIEAWLSTILTTCALYAMIKGVSIKYWFSSRGEEGTAR